MPATEPWTYSLHIPHDTRAVTVCRRTVRLILTLHGLIRLADVAELPAAELVSNAVRHAKGPAALRLRRRDGVLRIGAWDASPVPPPHDLEVTSGTEAGRGLALVRACADDWGRQPLGQGGDTGKYVWCDLAAAWLVEHVGSNEMRRDLMAPVNYFFRNPVADRLGNEGCVEGRIEDRIEMILRILELRGIEVSDSTRLRVRACSGLEQLKTWSERAVHVTDPADLFAPERGQ